MTAPEMMELLGRRQLGAMCLVAGTCIGSGTMALPLFLAQVGWLPSIGLMAGIWALVYYTSLVNVELNLQAQRGQPLGELAQRFSGPLAGLIGTMCLKLLSYALLTAYVYLGANVFGELLGGTAQEGAWGQGKWILAVAAGAAGVLMLPLRLVDYVNRVLFVGLIGVFGFLMFGLARTVDISKLPLMGPQVGSLKAWCTILPVVFTSFGFQVIFHTLTNYCKQEPRALKRVFFWGSLTPVAIYTLWTFGALSVLAHKQPEFYAQMAQGQVDAGQMVRALSNSTHWGPLQTVVWITTLLAIGTSLLGVGLGLTDALQPIIVSRLSARPFIKKLIALLVALLPAAAIAHWVPNAFVAFFAFAGMVLAVIAVLLPLYLLPKTPKRPFAYKALHSRWLRMAALLGGLIVFASEWIRLLL